jgi:transposase-like protein
VIGANECSQQCCGLNGEQYKTKVIYTLLCLNLEGKKEILGLYLSEQACIYLSKKVLLIGSAF